MDQDPNKPKPVLPGAIVCNLDEYIGPPQFARKVAPTKSKRKGVRSPYRLVNRNRG